MRWDASLLQQLAADPEIVLVMHRDGHPVLRLPVWVVVADGDAYIRSWAGRANVWFRRAAADPAQAIEVRGMQYDTRFVPVRELQRERIDAAYLAKYGRSGASPMTADLAAESTVRLEPLAT